MFEAWGRALYTRRRLTLGIALVLVAFAAVWGTGVFGKLSSGNSFTPPASQSQREADRASQLFGRNDADVVVLLAARADDHRSDAQPVRGDRQRDDEQRVIALHCGPCGRALVPAARATSVR